MNVQYLRDNLESVCIPQLDSVRPQPCVRELCAVRLQALQMALRISVGALIDERLHAVAQETLRAHIRTKPHQKEEGK